MASFDAKTPRPAQSFTDLKTYSERTGQDRHSRMIDWSIFRPFQREALQVLRVECDVVYLTSLAPMSYFPPRSPRWPKKSAFPQNRPVASGA